MQLFISYARVDKYYCSQIIDVIDVHEVWYDNRLHAGQQWWDEIQCRLEWCEGLIYLLSPDSVNSKYCQMELSIAQSLGKHIFPVLIQPRTEMPDTLKHIQYADLSKGLTTEAVKDLLNSIYVAERKGQTSRVPALASQGMLHRQIAFPEAPMPVLSEIKENVDSVMDQVADALDTGHFDQAVFLLKQILNSDDTPRFIDLNGLLQDAEDALEWQAYVKEAEREYRPIVSLIRRERTRSAGIRAFQAFHRKFPEYDPENLAGYCVTRPLVDQNWCSVPEGAVKIHREGRVETCHVEAFRIGKYAVTNAQYYEFITAQDGYCHEGWWHYSLHAAEWHSENPEPTFEQGKPDYPAVTVSWYDALAYCHWLSYRTGETITLPTEEQWQRAAQGDDKRHFPWGNQFDMHFCNTKESGLKQLTPVDQYPEGISPFGVWDMAGNTWEWCLNNEVSSSEVDLSNEHSRIIKGGAYFSSYKRASCEFHFVIDPKCRYDSIGFRVICLA